MKHIISILILLTFASQSFLTAQITPAPRQSEPIVITGVTAHLGNGEVMEGAYVGFDEGRITFLGDADSWPGYDSYKVIDHTGAHLYPGFIAPNTNLGLTEINAVRATRDAREVGEMIPNVRALIAYNTDSEVIPTVRSNGVLLASVVPSGTRIAGSSSVVQLDAWNWQDAVVHADNGIHLYWPAESTFNFRERRRTKNKDYQKQVDELKAFFIEAQAYAKNERQATQNLRMEAMRGVFDQSIKVFVHTNSVKGMQESVLLMESFEAKAVIVGGRESWMITDFLKDHNVGVILPPTHRLPAQQESDVDQPFKTPATLEEAGCFSASVQMATGSSLICPFRRAIRLVMDWTMKML